MVKKIAVALVTMVLIILASSHLMDKLENELFPNKDVHEVGDLNEGMPKVINQELKKSTPVSSHLPVSKTISDMSLDEKIGQMIISGVTGTEYNTTTKSLINQYNIGGLIFYEDSLVTPKQTVKLLNDVKQENVNNRFPLILSIDQEGGRISKLPGDLIDLPINKELGEVRDVNLSYQIGELLGKQLKAFGFNLDYAPVLDVNSNPNNPIIGDRSFGDNPEIVSELGIQTMTGIQSQGIISVIKHFPGHGDTSKDSHIELPEVDKSKNALDRLELIPFERAINQGANVVMVAHVLLPQIDASYPASMSKTIITDILRQQLKFQGVVITDDLTMKAVTDNFDIGQAAVKSVQAGSDIVMVAHDYNKVISVIEALKESVLQGDIKEERIDESVTRIIQLKKEYGLDNKKVKDVNVEKLNKEIKKVLNDS